MRNQIVRLLTVVLLLLTAASEGCRWYDGGEQQAVSTQPCPVTIPNGSQPPTKMLSGPLMHGNGKLWVGLSPDGIWLVKPLRNGSLPTKFAWWREVAGPLTLEGHRLDKPRESFHSASARDYGESGFIPSSANFSSAGCWEVTGKVNDTALTFVVDVRARNRK